MEEKLKSSLIKIVSYILGTGLVAHAVYIYSVAYYQGYMQELGFPIELFPADGLLLHVWSNTASRDLAGKVIIFVTSISTPGFMLGLAGAVLIIPLSKLIKWIFPSKKKKTELEREIEEEERKLETSSMRGIRKVLSNLMIYSKKLGFDTAYAIFNIISLSVIPLLYVCLAWIYFPDLAISQGNSLAKKHRANFEENLCGPKSSYWSRCYKLDLQHIGNVGKISTEFEKTDRHTRKLSSISR